MYVLPALFRTDQVLLTRGVSADNKSAGMLCRTERFVRGIARIGTPVYGARSRLGRLVLGAERFCGVDASPAVISSQSLVTVWRKGGGILGFTRGGELEMVISSGDVVWSLAEDHRFDELAVKARMNTKVIKMLEKKHDSERHKRLTRIAEHLELTAKRRKKEEAKDGGRKKKEKDDSEKKKKKKKKRWRKRVFQWKGGKASEAATDSTSPTAEGRPHGRNAFMRVLGLGRPSPKGAGGQGG